MLNRFVGAFLMSVFVLLSAAFAHDQSLHHGKPVSGEITTVKDAGFNLRTEKGEIEVTYTQRTVVELGMEGKLGSFADLKIGAHVMVTGTKLETGELVAKEIMVNK